MGRTVAHRLYLSALAVLVALGVVVVAAAIVSKVHDDRVTDEDRRCYSAALNQAVELRQARERGRQRAVALLPDGGFDPDAYLAATDAEQALTKKGDWKSRSKVVHAAPPKVPAGWKLVSQGFDPDAYLAKKRAVLDNDEPGLPPLPPGATLDPPVGLLDAEVAALEAPAGWEDLPDVAPCHLSFQLQAEGRSTRAWVDLTAGQVALSFTSFSPALFLWAFARWLRWLLKPPAGG